MNRCNIFFIALIVTIFGSQFSFAQQQESAAELNVFKPEARVQEKAVDSAEEDERNIPIKMDVQEGKKTGLSIKDYDEQGAKKIKPFELKQVSIEGVHTFDQANMESLYADMIGKIVDFEKLSEIAYKISTFYIDRGYVLTHAYIDLDHSFKDGVAKFKIINGTIRQVHILGVDKDNNVIKGYEQKIIAAKPVTKKMLQRYIKLIDRMSGYEVQLVKIMLVQDHLRNNTDEHADLVVVVKKVANTVQLNLTDNINKVYGTHRASATIGMFSPFKNGEEIRIGYVTSNTMRALQNIGLNYTHPLNNNGTTFKSMVSYTESNPSVAPGSNYLVQKDNLDYRMDMGVSHPFILTNKYSFVGDIGLGFDHDTQYSFLGKLQQNINTELVASAVMHYKDDIKGFNHLALAYGHGLPVSKYKSFKSVSQGASQVEKNYDKLHFDYYRSQYLVQNFFFTSLVSGQYANKPLPSGEKISFGGSGMVRGYKSETLAASKGTGLQLELMYLLDIQHAYLRRAEIYGFYDLGKVGILDGEQASNNTTTTMISSRGYGVKANLAGNLKAGFEVAYPLKSFANSPIEIRKNKPNTTVFIEHIVEW